MKQNFQFEKYGINTPQDLFEFFKQNFQYGFVDDLSLIHTTEDRNFDADFDKLYKIRLFDDFALARFGVCWDFAEFERAFMKGSKIDHKVYYIEAFDKITGNAQTHTFVAFKSNDTGKWNWFEFSWGNQRGIHEFDSLEKLIQTVAKKHLKTTVIEKTNLICACFEYDEVTKRLNPFEFVQHAHRRKPVFEKDCKLFDF